MSEIVKKVAQDLHDEWNGVGRWSSLTDRERGLWIEMARTAIFSMRTPTKEMEEAGFLAGHLGDGAWEYAAPDEAYRAMIDEALK